LPRRPWPPCGAVSCPAVPATITSKCGAEPGATSVTVTLNGAFTWVTQSLIWPHFESPPVNAVSETGPPAMSEVSVVESVLPSWTWQPLAQRLRYCVCELTRTGVAVTPGLIGWRARWQETRISSGSACAETAKPRTTATAARLRMDLGFIPAGYPPTSGKALATTY